MSAEVVAQDPPFLYGYLPSILEGAQMTIAVGVCSLIIAMLIGIVVALIKLSNSKILSSIAFLYTTIIRGIPDLVLMLLIFYGGQVFVNNAAEWVGYEEYIDINPFIAGSITIGVIFGAYMAETFRGAILAVDSGQLEAGHAYGMTNWQVFSRILLPQMVRHAIPSFGNNWLVMLKSTALVSIIGLDDMVRKSQLAAGATKKPFTFYLVVAAVFLLLTSISTTTLDWLNRRYSVGFKKG